MIGMFRISIANEFLFVQVARDQMSTPLSWSMFNFFKSPATHADMIRQWQTITSECLFQVARDQMFNSSTCSASYLVQVSSRTRGHDQAVAKLQNIFTLLQVFWFRQVARDQMYNHSINSPAAHAGMTRQWRAQDRGDKSLLEMSRLKQKCKSRLDFQTRVTILAETYIPASRASSWCYAPWPAQRTWLM